VRQLIERAKDPITGGDAWAELQMVAEELRQELPNAEVTDDVTAAVDADERPSEERVNELLSEAKKVLERIQSVNGRLDRLEDGSIVLLED
jgi:FtsZ-binding cell division protein ZapB